MRAIAIGLVVVLTGCSDGSHGPEAAPTDVVPAQPSGLNTGPGRHPFPQAFDLPHCTPVAGDVQDVVDAYARYRAELVTAEGAGGFLRVVRPDTPDGLANSTVSEGIAYGMIIGVLLNDKDLFDGLWGYAQLWSNANGLMEWYIDPEGIASCPGEDTCGAATDADEDMAWALIMAERQWGEASYAADARRLLELIYAQEVEMGTLTVKPGNFWGGAHALNLSYFAPAYYRVFADFMDDERWLDVIDANYEILERTLNEANGNRYNGMVPAWSNALGDPVEAWPGAPVHHQYDSARMPFRIGQDHCYYGEPRATAYLSTHVSFFAEGGAEQIYDGYDLDGMPRPEASDAPGRSAVFTGSVGTGAMFDPAYQALAQGAYEEVATGELLVRSRYYQHSWTVMSLLMMGGHFAALPEE